MSKKAQYTEVRKHQRSNPISPGKHWVIKHDRFIGYRDPGEIRLLEPTHIADIHGVGSKTAETLYQYGYITIEDAHRLANDPYMQKAVQKDGVRPQTLKAIFDAIDHQPKRQMIQEPPIELEDRSHEFMKMDEAELRQELRKYKTSEELHQVARLLIKAHDRNVTHKARLRTVIIQNRRETIALSNLGKDYSELTEQDIRNAIHAVNAKESRFGGLIPMDQLKAEIAKSGDYSDEEINKKLLDLERARKIDLQTAYDAGTVTNPEKGISLPSRGLVFYIRDRNPERHRIARDEAKKPQESSFDETAKIQRKKEQILLNINDFDYVRAIFPRSQQDPIMQKAVEQLEKEGKIQRDDQGFYQLAPRRLSDKELKETSWDDIIKEQEAIKKQRADFVKGIEKAAFEEAAKIDIPASYPLGTDLRSDERYYVIIQREDGKTGIAKWHDRPIYAQNEKQVKQALEKAKAGGFHTKGNLVIVPGRDKLHAARKVADMKKIDVLVTNADYKDRKFWRHEKNLKPYYVNQEFVGWRGKLKKDELDTLKLKKHVIIQETKDEFTEEMQGDSRAQRLEKKADKKLSQAERQRNISHQEWKEATKLSEIIPVGQPILVDHYSAPRHRKHLAKIHKKQDKSLEAQKQAEKLEKQAESLKITAGYKKGDRQREREAHIKHTDTWLKVGKPAYSAIYGEGIVTKVNKKTVRIKRSPTESDILVEKEFMHKSRDAWLGRGKKKNK